MKIEKNYKRSHHNVTRIFHWDVSKWYEHKIETTEKKLQAKNLWDFMVEYGQEIEHRTAEIMMSNEVIGRYLMRLVQLTLSFGGENNK